MGEVKTVLPEQIHTVEYAGFWDFNSDGFYGPSLLDVEDNPNAEQVAEEIVKRYNENAELKKNDSVSKSQYVELLTENTKLKEALNANPLH